MAEKTFTFEIDRGNMSPEDFAAIENKLISDIIQETVVAGDIQNAWHIKADFDKHTKGGIGISGLGTDDMRIRIDPASFNAASNSIEKIKVSRSDF